MTSAAAVTAAALATAHRTTPTSDFRALGDEALLGRRRSVAKDVRLPGRVAEPAQLGRAVLTEDHPEIRGT